MGGGTKLSDDQLPSASVSDELSSSVPWTSSPSSRHLVAYLDLLESYVRPPDRSADLRPLKDSIARYKPGDWIDHVGGTTLDDYDVPDATTLLLVGPRGSGKSSLLNRIARVFGDELFASDPAQVSHNLSVADGTCFLQECMVLKSPESLCVYDSRSLSESSSENLEMLQKWMTEGVSHGQMVVRTSDTIPMKQRMGIMARHRHFSPCLKRTVNFVIFVVDGVSVLKSMDDDAKYNKMIAANFNCPYLSFKDDKPVVVVTHGDELSFQERARVRAHLGEILGIPPSKQIFDIPDTCVSHTELAIMDMLHYSIEHADRNLPFNKSCLLQAQRIIRRKMEKFLDDWVVIISVVFIIYIILVYFLFQVSYIHGKRIGL